MIPKKNEDSEGQNPMTRQGLNSGRPFRVFDVVSNIMPVKDPILKPAGRTVLFARPPISIIAPAPPCLRYMVVLSPLRPMQLLLLGPLGHLPSVTDNQPYLTLPTATYQHIFPPSWTKAAIWSFVLMALETSKKILDCYSELGILNNCRFDNDVRFLS